MPDETPLAAKNGGSRPVPDPTELTDRAIARSEKSQKQYIDGQLAIRDERLNGIDEATKLRLTQAAALVDGFSGEIDVKVGSLELLHAEKFSSISTQFRERDIRAEREARDNKVAVDAAFAAQKEAAAKQDEANAKAIDKSERATAETIKTNQELSKATSDALTKNLDELKQAVTRIESRTVGAQENRAQSTESRTTIIAVVGVVAAILGVVTGVVVSVFGA